MITTIINAVVYGSLGLSTVITYFNHSSSNSRIRRKGKIIKPITTNSVSENIKYFIKDFGFIFIPVYNVIRSVKQTMQRDADFDAEKMARLEDRDRLESVKVEEPVKVETPVKKEEEEDFEDDFDRDDEPVVKKTPAPVKTETPSKVITCYEKRDALEKEYYRLLNLHRQAKSSGKSVSELNQIARKMKEIVSAYSLAKKQCEIEDLKNHRNLIISSMEEPRKLIRK